MNAHPVSPFAQWLVVDDNPQITHLLGLMLKSFGLASVEEFTCSQTAYQRAASGEVDLVVTDRDMPGMDGLELARRLRIEAPKTKIVMVSAHLDDLTAGELQAAGISAAMAKPFTIRELEGMIRRVLLKDAILPVEAGFPKLRHAA